MLDDLGDFTFGGQSSEGGLGKRSSDLHSLGGNGSGDDLVAWDFLVEFVEGGLIEQSQVDELVSNFTLAPLLLFTLGAAHSGFGLGLFGFLDLGWHNLDSYFLKKKNKDIVIKCNNEFIQIELFEKSVWRYLQGTLKVPLRL